mgnify:CR=1 FL=1
MGTTNLDTLALGGNLTVAGTSTITGSTVITGDLAVSGTITGVVDVDVSSTLEFDNGDAIVDTSDNELIEFGVTASAVNEITVKNAATGAGPTILSTGGDTNIPVTLGGKGTGHVVLGQATSTDVRLAADQPLADSSGNELVKFAKVASAVNEITIGNNSTGLGPTLTASGETNTPVTLAGKGTGYVGLGQATSTDVRLVADQPIADSSGNELIKFSKAATAVNEFTIANGATSSGPTITATGGDADIPAYFRGKGTGAVYLGQATTQGVVFIADQPLLDSANNELVKFVATGTAVNEFTVTNAATGTDPTLSATGGDANIGVVLLAKGTGAVTVRNTDAGTLGSQLTLTHAGGSQANSDVVGRVLFNGQDDAAALESYAKIDVVVTDITAANPDADMIFYTDVAGSLIERIRISSGGGLTVGASGVAGLLQSNGAANLTLQTGSGTGAKIAIVDGASGGIKITPNATGDVKVESTDGGTLGSQFTLAHVGGSQLANDVVGRFLVNGQDDAAAAESYAKIDVIAKDVAAASPDGILAFYVDVAGTLTEKMRIDADLVGLQIGDGAVDATLRSNGNFDLILKTGNATSGSITIADGAAGNISITPDTTGQTTTTRLQASIGVQTTPSAVTSTVDGLTTGIIAAGTGAVSVTSADANNIITLPTAVVGNRIMIYLGGTGCELRTPALSNATINTVDSDGTNELALVANGVFTCTCNSATNWVIHGWTNLGAAIATLIPDAA